MNRASSHYGARASNLGALCACACSACRFACSAVVCGKRLGTLFFFECRYRFNPGAVLAELKKRLKWADGATVKKEMDSQVR